MSKTQLLIVFAILLLIVIIGIGLSQIKQEIKENQIKQDSLAWQIDMCNKMDCWIDNPAIDRT